MAEHQHVNLTRRLAMRVEGEWWVAYFAEIGTMDRALEVGRIRVNLAEVPAIKALAMAFFQNTMTEIIKAVSGGIEIAWPNPPERAPEHERAGRG